MSTMFNKELIKKYFLNILIGLDNTLNAVLGGDPDETISSRLGKAKRNGSKIAFGICWALNKIIFWRDDLHCMHSIEDDEGKDAIVKSKP